MAYGDPEGQRSYDVLVIGGGIAGASLAYELSADRAVCLVEMESTLAFHTTGRSAATFLESYGNRTIRALTAASRAFLTEPPEIFASALVTPLGLLYLATPDRVGDLRALHAEVLGLGTAVELLDSESAREANPTLRPGYTELAMTEPGALEVDVHALHQGYVRGLRARGGAVVVSAGVVSAVRANAAWSIADRSGRTFAGSVLVNAAGAWSDQVGRLTGAAPVGLVPLRRTVFMVPAPAGVVLDRLPLTIDIGDDFYLKPEGAQFLCSPADETPQEPGDAKPDELEIARAIDGINNATTLGIRRVTSSWAGQRTFAPDRTPVVGFDPSVEGFFWFAGQGGYGIQTCPALARAGAVLLRGEPLPADLAARGVTPEALDPGRFA